MKSVAFGTMVLVCMLVVGFSCETSEKNAQVPPTARATPAEPLNTTPAVAPAPSRQEQAAQVTSQAAQVTSPQPAGPALNSTLTAQAWEAFNGRNYDGAISAADKCIDEFLGSAMREQETLEAKKTPLPPTGTVSSQRKQEINARGLLNDVATCLYVKGRALEAKKQKEDAIRAYETAAKLTYARCWDPQGWFWSPSEGSLDRLRILK